jgi:ABC-type iron transport system FetAB ATPase subunit
MPAKKSNSGSGKTTLLNILAHRAAVQGATVKQDLYINGNPTDLATFRKLSSYVEQEDALVGSLSVRETLYFAAQLALPRYVLPQAPASYLFPIPRNTLPSYSSSILIHQLCVQTRPQSPHFAPPLRLRSAKPG